MPDATGYFECQQDEEAKKGFMSVPKNLREARKEIKEMLSAMHKKRPIKEIFAIEINGEFAGYVGINDLNEKHSEHRAYVGYCLNKKFRRRGITTEAVKLVTNYAFKKYKLKRIESMCRTFNKASAGVLRNAGFKLEGILRKNKFKNGKYLDDMMFAKIK
jgi:RimJ/RimL family protein N-acetyltransferase